MSAFVDSLVLIIVISKFVVVFIKSLVNKITFRFNQRMQMVMTFQKHRYKEFLSYSSIIVTSFSQPINDDIKKKFLNLNFIFKESMLWVFFLHISLGRKERINYPQKNII